jgi:hypothetical protein
MVGQRQLAKVPQPHCARPKKIVTGKIVLVIGNKIKYDFAAWSESGVKLDSKTRFRARQSQAGGT